jgi:hypothetical protein
MTVIIPVGVLADVTIPALQFTTANSTIVSDAATGTAFWKDGVFINGVVPGVIAAGATSSGILVTTGSGKFSLKADGQVARN